MKKQYKWGDIKKLSLPETAVILPVQFYEQLHRPRPDNLSPEKKLICALLEEAMWCLHRPPVGKSKLARNLSEEAYEWITSSNETPFSFRWCCYHLGINPDYFQARIRKHQEFWRNNGELLLPSKRHDSL